MVYRSSALCLSAFSFVCFSAMHNEGRQTTRRKRPDRFFILQTKEWSLWIVNEAWGFIRMALRCLM